MSKADPESHEYAKVAWCVGDIQTVRPSFTVGQCEKFLFTNERYIQDAMVQAGWDAIASLADEEDDQ